MLQWLFIQGPKSNINLVSNIESKTLLWTHGIRCSSLDVYFRKLRTSVSRSIWPHSFSTKFILHVYIEGNNSSVSMNSTFCGVLSLLTKTPYVSRGIFFCKLIKLVWSSNRLNDMVFLLQRFINTDKATTLIFGSCWNKKKFVKSNMSKIKNLIKISQNQQIFLHQLLHYKKHWRKIWLDSPNTAGILEY